MKIDLYHVDAFTNTVFKGNPAAVCILSNWLSDESLTNIAKENNLPVTAFIVKDRGIYYIRWITPNYELDLCGHGSLAAGYVLLNFIQPKIEEVDFHSRLEVLPVIKKGNLITLNFPAKNIEPCSFPVLAEGLGLDPKEIYQHKTDRCIAVFENENDIKNLQPNMQILKKLEYRGISVTAKGDDVDFVSRTFYPHKTISEDPATGASHCLLAPYWASKLQKNDFHTRQLSERGGEIFCQYQGDRVLISGEAKLYMQGMIQIS